MMQRPSARLGGGLICLALAIPGSVWAKEESPVQIFTRPLATNDLESKRAGDSTEVFNHINITGSADNISVHNATTGKNSIGGTSFSGAQGFPIVIQNSGNGVLIQNATIINMTVKP
jgi:hypothetical protein